METPSQTLIAGARALGIILSAEQVDLFSAFLEELLFWNRRMNLVAEASPQEIVIKHFLDSLTSVSFITRKEGSLLDIGTGAGFPGIPLRIAIPALRVSLLEASRKKTSFLKHLIRSLSLEGTTIIHKRVEESLQEEMYRSCFDTVISRAAMNFSALLTTAGYFLTQGGVLIAMKGVNIERPLAEASLITASLGLINTGCHLVELPISRLPRMILVYRKIRGLL